MNLSARIYSKAYDLGFELVGVAPVYPVPYLEAYQSWIDHGYHGEMVYMARPDRVERRENPDRIVPGVRSVICVGLNYYPGPMIADVGQDPSRGLISNYAWGIDYHDLMVPRLEELSDFVDAELGARTGRGSTYRVYVDTGPVLERAYAAQAGLGFIGKNTCLIHPQKGSWLFLGEILTDVELDPTSGEAGVSCGTCRRCLDACPTKALVAPYVLDARRCISYLTIELRGPIPVELRPLIKNRVYGCDECQVVCPWQRFARPTEVDAFQAAGPDRAAPALVDILAMSEKAFRGHYEGTPVLRIGRSRLLRNAAIALGNWGSERATGALERALVDAEPLVRGHAAWALGRIGGRDVESTLQDALQSEKDPYVLREIGMAIEMGLAQAALEMERHDPVD